MQMFSRLWFVCCLTVLSDAVRAVHILPQKVINLEWDLSSGHRIVNNLVDKVWANSYMAESLDVVSSHQKCFVSSPTLEVEHKSVLTDLYFRHNIATFYHFYQTCKTTVAVQIDRIGQKLSLHKFARSEKDPAALSFLNLTIEQQVMSTGNESAVSIQFSEKYSDECDLFSFAFLEANSSFLAVEVHECSFDALECVSISRVDEKTLNMSHPVRGIFYDNHILTLIDNSSLRSIKTFKKVVELRVIQHSLDTTDLINFLSFQGVYFAVQKHGIFPLEIFYGKLKNTSDPVITPEKGSTTVIKGAANTKNHFLIGTIKDQRESLHVLDPIFAGEDYKVQRMSLDSLKMKGFGLLYSYDSNYRPNKNGLPDFRLDYQDLTIMIGKTFTPIIFNSYQATTTDPRITNASHFSNYSTKAEEKWLDEMRSDDGIQAVIAVGTNKNDDLYHLSTTRDGGANLRRLRLTRPLLDCTLVSDEVFENSLKNVTLEIFYRMNDDRFEQILPIKYHIRFTNSKSVYRRYAAIGCVVFLLTSLGLYIKACYSKIREANEPLEYYPEYRDFLERQAKTLREHFKIEEEEGES